MHHIAIWLIFLLSVFSCRRPGLEIGLFDASLEIITSEVADGENFIFRIHSTENEFKVVSYDCDFRDDQIISSGNNYTIANFDYKEFIFPEVNISKTHVGTLSVTIQSVISGKVIELSETYIARQTIVVTASIDAPVIDETRLLTSNHYQTIVEGSDVTLTFKSNYKTLILTDFDCELNTDGTLFRGMSINFDERGEWSHLFENVKIEDERYKSPSKMRFTFRAPSAIDTQEIEAPLLEYIKLKRPKISMEIKTTTIYGKGQLSFELSSTNREQISLMYVDCSAISEISNINAYQNVSSGIIKLYDRGGIYVSTVISPEFTVKRRETVPFTVHLKDTDLTNEYCAVSGTFFTQVE